jgi:hypothetical protein
VHNATIRQAKKIMIDRRVDKEYVDGALSSPITWMTTVGLGDHPSSYGRPRTSFSWKSTLIRIGCFVQQCSIKTRANFAFSYI